MIIIGLTGSIGMGKSTTAGMFADEGIPVNDADQVVHDLYAGEAVPLIAEDFPEAIVDRRVDRQLLSKTLAKNPDKLKAVEAIVHPLVRNKEREFVTAMEREGRDLVVLDIPLLFEVGRAEDVDVIVVASCDADQQRQRVLARPNMSVEKFEFILSRQMPDAEKRRRADYIVDTGHGMDAARKQVRAIIAELRAKQGKR
ncbi:dephospho-CoA kinase [Rhizobium sp. PAMB 3182]